MIRFRQRALDSLSTPEALDQPLPLLRASWWGILLGLLLFSGTALVWAFVGRLPVRIQGRGVLVRPESLVQVQSRSSGPVEQLLKREGDCVRAGQPMARIEQVQLRLGLEEGRRRLEQLRRQDQLARLQASRERALVADDLTRLLPYRYSGTIAEETYIDKEKQLQRIDGQQLAEAQQRAQAISAEVLAMASKEQELGLNQYVVAPLSGCVVEALAQPGVVVNPGTVLFTMERNDRRGELVSLAYFPSQDGKRLKPGQLVRITPNTTNAQRHGGIQGRILSIRNLPVTREGLKQRFGVESLVDAVWPSAAAATNEPLIEAVTSLQRDPRSRSGYNWGGGAGPDLQLTVGTSTSVSVLVEGRQPISYVIPLLRDLSGIY